MEAEIRGYFEAEAKELIDRLTQGVARLEGLDGAAAEAALGEALPGVLRAAHTLKGAAHVVGERGLAALAHAFEDAAAGYREQPSAAGAAGLLQAVDGLARELAGGEKAAPAAGEAVERPGDAGVEKAGVEKAAVGKAGVEKAGVERAGVGKAGVGRVGRAVRVDVTHTTRLVNGLAASGVLLGSMRGVLTELEALAKTPAAEGEGSSKGIRWEQGRVRRDHLRQQLMDLQERLERAMRDLQAQAAHLRLGAAETLLLEAGRTVRATAAAVGRRVAFVSRGGEERLDLRLQDALQDALLHLLRNAVAHGVESEREREAAGKPAVATVEVTVERVGRFIEVGCTDDGRGIATEPLRARARELGLEVPETQAGTLALLLRPGFNRGGPVTEVSGRGVGMEAVREAVEGVGGTVEVVSEVGHGTTFTMRVPQSLFALRTLEVRAGGRTFALPLEEVEQTFLMERHLTEQVQGSTSLLVGPRMVSLVRLNEAFPTRPEAVWQDGLDDFEQGEGVGRTCVVLKAGDDLLACVVDRLLGVGETLVRPVSPLARVGAHVAGTALSAAGVPYLVVHPAELLQRVRSGGVMAGSRGNPQAAETRRRPILVIDDSLTTRMLEQSILETEGYEVELAHSAEQGLAMARKKEYALFLVDVEMPGMNGFEFVALVTSDAQLKTTPAILVTSLDSAEHRERGRKAGAVSYVVKGEFNQQVYLDRIRAVAGRNA